MNEQDVWSGSSTQEADVDIRMYIQTRVQILFAVFSKKSSEELVLVFQNRLEQFSQPVLRKVFDRCESELERFPTVKQVLGFCYTERPSETWRYNYVPSTDEHGVECLEDPDPNCSRCREPRSLHPHAKCQEYESTLQNHLLYRPQNCPEGKAFLALMESMAVKKIPLADLELSRQNLQAQAVAITKADFGFVTESISVAPEFFERAVREPGEDSEEEINGAARVEGEDTGDSDLPDIFFDPAEPEKEA